MQFGQLALFILSLIFLTSISFAVIPETTHTVGPYVEGKTFTVEGARFTVEDIVAKGTYSPFSGSCVLSTSNSYVLVNFGGSIRDGTTNLSQGESDEFIIPETATSRGVRTTLELEDIDATFTYTCLFTCSCAVSSSSKKATFVVTTREEYYCTDPDEGNPLYASTATSVTAKTIKSNKTNSTHINLYTIGQVSGQSIFPDVCVNATHLKERKCTEGSILDDSIITSATNYVCSSGRFVLGDPVCTDNDGIDATTAGTVTVSRQKEGVSRIVATYGDSCIDANTAREAACSGTSMINRSIACPTGYSCTGTKCIPPIGPTSTIEEFCSDNDADSLTVRGTTRAGARNSTTLIEVSGNDEQDGCVDSNTVKEYSCDGSVRVALDRDCPSGQVCSSGKCVAPSVTATPYCSDTDGGQKPELKGTVEWGLEDSNGNIIERNTVNDECLSQTVLSEYYCDNAEQRNSRVTCASDQICQGGGCITKGEPPKPQPPPTPPPQPPKDDEIKIAADNAIKDAESTINIAQNANKNVSEAKTLISSAQDSFDKGDYKNALSLANSAKELAIKANEIRKPEEKTALDQNTVLAIGAIILVIIVLVYSYMKKKGGNEKVAPVTGQEKPPVTVQ